MERTKHLDVNEVGPANELRVDDRFVFHGSSDKKQHVVTQDDDSHLVYDGRPNKRLSKDTIVMRVGERDEEETLQRTNDAYDRMIKGLESSGDVQAWTSDVDRFLSLMTLHGYDETSLQSVDVLQKIGVATFSRAKGKRNGRRAIESLDASERKNWVGAVSSVRTELNSTMTESLVREHVRHVLCAFTSRG